MDLLLSGYLVRIDHDDYMMYSKYKLRVVKTTGGKLYVVRSHKRKHVYLHREILNAQMGIEVDHINGNSLDNRRSNLRMCTRHENMKNTKKGSTNRFSSKYKGVSWDAKRDRWRCRITVDGKTINLGWFVFSYVAAKVYDRHAIKYHRSFARLNFPEKA